MPHGREDRGRDQGGLAGDRYPGRLGGDEDEEGGISEVLPALNSNGRLGLVLQPRSDPTPVAEKLERWARSHGKQVIADERHAARLPAGIEPVSAEQLVEKADALISLGGDGTMLGALRLVAHRPVRFSA